MGKYQITLIVEIETTEDVIKNEEAFDTFINKKGEDIFPLLGFEIHKDFISRTAISDIELEQEGIEIVDYKLIEVEERDEKEELQSKD